MNPGRAAAAILVMVLCLSARASGSDSRAEPGASKQQKEEKAGPAKTKASGSAKGSKKAPVFRFSGTFALRFIYDDNIIHYSDEDIEEFSTVPNEGRYAVRRISDYIVRPRLEITARSKRFTGKNLDILLRLSSWRYVENGIKNNESIYVRLKHPGFGGDNFQLSFYYAPEAYLRNFLDRPPFTPLSQSSEFTEFAYTSNSLTLAYWRRLNKSTDGKLQVGHSWRYYNRAFMENDNWEWKVGGYISRKITKRIKLTGEYLYSHVKARAADAIGEPLGSADDGDASYERDSYDLSVNYRPKGGLLIVNSITVSGQYQAYYFTSQQPFWEDRFHVGRKDEVYRLELSGTSRKVWGPVSLEGGYRFTERTSTAAWEAEGENIGEDKDYTDNRFWLGMKYPF